MHTATHRRVSRAMPKFGMLALGVVVLVMCVAPIASARQPADIKLASSTDGRTLKLGDVADDDNLIAVAFQERNLSYVRWSKNYGSSFAPKVALRAGLRAKDPRVAVCDDLVFAVSIWQSDVTRNVGVDYRDVLTGTNGRFSLGAGSLADVACFGEVVAVTWVLDDHLWLAVHEGSCANPCVPEVKMDLGTGNFDSPPRISSDGDGFVAAWVTDGIAVQYFAYDAGGGGSFNITPSPVVTLMAGKNVYLPVIGGGGPRVALAYGRDGQTHVRIRDDYGAPFGPRIIVSRFCRNCPEGGSQPESVDVSGDNILVEVLSGGGVPTAYEANAFLTTDNGSHWVKNPGHGGGFQRGVLLSGVKFAEAWDAHFYNGFPYPETEQLIGFHVRQL